MKLLSKAQKAAFGAYAAVISMSVVLTILIMSGVQGEAAIPAEPSLYTLWTLVAGAIGGGVAMVLSRGWLGQTGAMGHARAAVGAFALTLIGAVITGALIFQVSGAFFAPVMLTTELLSRPALAIAWFGTLFGAHYLLMQRTIAQQERDHEIDARFVSAELSSLTQAQLYGRR